MARPTILVLLLSMLVLPSIAEETEDPEIWIHTRLTDMTVARAVGTMAELGELEVSIEERLRNRRVTLDIEAPVVGALDLIAKAANAHLWKIADGKYAVRSKPPPASAVVPSVEIEGTKPEEEQEPRAPDPPWIQRIAKALETRADLPKPRKATVPEALADLAKRAGVPLHIDPAALKAKSVKGVEFDYWDPLGDSSVGDLLLLFTAAHELDYQFRWGVVFVSTRARMWKTPEDVFVSGEDELPEAVATALSSHLITRGFRRASLPKVVEALAAQAGIEIVVTKSVPKAQRKRRITVKFEGRKLEDALAILLVPAGLGLKVEGSTLKVMRRP